MSSYDEGEVINSNLEGMRLFNVFTESKDHDINTNEPSS